MRQLKTQRPRGLTLVELLVALAVTAILLTAAVPPMFEYVGNARLHQAGTTALADALFAQSEGIKRNGRVQLELSGRSVQVVDRSTGTPQVLRSRVLPEGVVFGGNATLVFGSSGRPEPWGTEYAVSVWPAQGSCPGGMQCPLLRVSAGGALRLCADAGACP